MTLKRILGVAFTGLAASVAIASPAMAAGTLDQQYTTDLGGALVEGLDVAAQTFTAGLTGQLDQVDVKIMHFGGSGPDLILTIKATSSGVPSGAALTTEAIPRSAVSGSASWVTVPLSSPVSVVAGTQYAIILTPSTTATTGYRWDLGWTNVYTGGGWFQTNDGGSSWSLMQYPPETGNFRTYVSVISPGSGPPPVMQQFGMPASGTCEAAAPIVLNWGGAGSGGWGNSWAEWMNSGNGGSVCTRTLDYSNAAGHWIVG